MITNPYEFVFLKPDDSLEDWDRFVEESPQGSIFCCSWWLKTVCPENFMIFTVVKAGKIVAGIPLPISHAWRHTIINMPLFTQTLGILFAPSKKNTYEARLSEEMKLMDMIILNLPHFHFYSIDFHYNFHNWLPFYWAGYKQTIRYTYIIPDVSDLDRVYENMSHMGRQVIKKASNRYGITIFDSDDVEILLKLNKQTFLRQGIEMPYSAEVVKIIYRESVAKNAGKIFLAKDQANNIHSALFVVQDKKSVVGVISGADPKLRESGSNALLIWHAIQFAQQVSHSYNFGGSMIKNIEFFMRTFGAVQTPYFHISKDNRHLPLLMNNLLYLVDNRLKRIINKRDSNFSHTY